MGQVQNEELLCRIAVIGVERPNKATVERAFEERRSGDSGAWSVCGRQPERIQRVNAETTERVDVPRTRRVRTFKLSLSVYNKLPESSRANPVRFLPSYELCYIDKCTFWAENDVLSSEIFSMCSHYIKLFYLIRMRQIRFFII